MLYCETSEISVLTMAHTIGYSTFLEYNDLHILCIRMDVVDKLVVSIFVTYRDDMHQYTPIYTVSYSVDCNHRQRSENLSRKLIIAEVTLHSPNSKISAS
jgi:hypothetical protein